MLKEIHQLYNDLDKQCNILEISGWHRYGPIEPTKYAKSDYRVLFLNSESVGFEGCGPVPADEVLKWLDYNTPRNCALMNFIIFYLIDYYKEKKAFPYFDYNFYKKTRADIDSLKAIFVFSAYMNTRISSNDTGSFNEDIHSVNNEIIMFQSYRKKLIHLLDPALIVIGGKQAKNAVSNLYGLSLEYNTIIKMENTTLLVLKHTSRLSFLGGYSGIDSILKKRFQI